MSWQIPTQIEQDIIAGKATYRTFQTGNGGQSILPVPANAYVVIFGYDFSPAGGGFSTQRTLLADDARSEIHPNIIRWFETQQIAFYTGSDFYPFIHHVDTTMTSIPKETNASVPDAENIVLQLQSFTIDNTPIARQVYITSSNDITITHGLILQSTQVSSNPIPVTNRTPLGLTYGGSGQSMNTQTNYGPVGTPLQFMQPSPKDYQDFGFGLLPSNADGQAFATPDGANGLLAASTFMQFSLPFALDAAASNYYLCLHYALYNKPIPEKQG